LIYLDSSFVLSYLFKDNMYNYAKEILESNERFWSSDLLRYECLVSLWKRFPKGDSERFYGFEELKKKIEFLSIHPAVYQVLEANPKISRVRTLDSIHIASVICIEKATKEKLVLATFDERMLEVAQSLKITLLNAKTSPKKK